jgi:hypothetical protein
MILAFAGKSMAVAVVYVDVAAKQVKVQRFFSFLTKYRVKYT